MQGRRLSGFAFLGFLSMLQISTAALRNAECHHKPADVVFVMDASGSISTREFDQQKNFINAVIDSFDVAENKTRVALVQFSKYGSTEFNLNEHYKKRHLFTAVRKTTAIRGDTNTEHALKHVRTSILEQHNGARYGVPQIVIVLTDGEANDAFATVLEASKLHDRGVYIFAIGIGDKIHKEELEAYATKPADKFTFYVDDFRSLYSIKDVLANGACLATSPPTTKAPPTLPPLYDQACGDVNAADIVFAIAPSSSTEHADKALAFYREFANQLEVSSDKVRVGLVPKDCNAVPGMELSSYGNKDAILGMLQDLQFAEDTPAKVLQHMHYVSFSEKHGSRRHARKLGVLILDESVLNYEGAQREALKARTFGHVELFIIGVGNVNADQMMALASKPYSRHVFSVTSYDDLHDLATTVRKAVCPYEYTPTL